MESKNKSKSFAIIKPGFLQHREGILKMLEEKKFNVISEKMYLPTLKQIERHYKCYKGECFFGRLTEYMISGPIIALALEKEGDDAVSTLHDFAGTKIDPAEGTIRYMFGTNDILLNVIHTSDSDETAKEELANFFPELEF